MPRGNTGRHVGGKAANGEIIFNNHFIINHLKKRKRSALSTTEVDERAIAVPPIMGESIGPPQRTCNSPIATGIPKML